MHKNLTLKLFFTFLIGIFMTTNAQADSNTLYMDLASGRVVIQLQPELAPNHVERIQSLTKSGFYDGIIFHRVIDGFMAQTGDPTGTGMGGSDEPDLQAEFSDANFGRGTVGMARSSNPHSANSQFFICFDDCSFLNGQYTIFGQVIDGMEHVDSIARGEPPAEPDAIIRMSLAKEAEAAE